MAVSLSPDQVLALRSLCSQLAQAAKGQKAMLKESMARQMNCSVATLHRHLKAVGYTDGRKPRCDKGKSVVNADDARMLSSALAAGTRQNGKRNLSLDDARELMQTNGKLPGLVDTETGEVRMPSASTISRVLKRSGLHPDQIAAPTPHMPMRYPHPNHTWQIDASVCVVFYLADGGAKLMDQSRFYKNKPEQLKSIEQQRVIRFVCWDGCSGAVMVRYYLGEESAENLIDFFIWCVQQRSHRGQPMPFYGVPKILHTDQGSANRSHLFGALLQALEVRLITHMPGNSRATGGAESTQNIVETKFEHKLAFCRTSDLDDLNAKACDWMHAFNASRRHSRHGHTRYGLWSTIRAEQLRVPPAEDILRALPTSRIETRVVEGDLSIGYAPARLKGARYDVAAVPGVWVGGTVEVSLNPYERSESGMQYVRVRALDTGEEAWTSCAPLAIGLDGVRTDAPEFGSEFASPGDTLVDSNRKALLKATYDADTLGEARQRKYGKTPAFMGELNAFAPEARVNLPSFLPKRGTQIDVPSPVQLEAKPYSIIEAARWAVARLRRPLTPAENAWMRGQWPNGVPEPDLDALLAALQGEQQAPPVAAAGGLRLV